MGRGRGKGKGGNVREEIPTASPIASVRRLSHFLESESLFVHLSFLSLLLSSARARVMKRDRKRKSIAQRW